MMGLGAKPKRGLLSLLSLPSIPHDSIAIVAFSKKVKSVNIIFCETVTERDLYVYCPKHEAQSQFSKQAWWKYIYLYFPPTFLTNSLCWEHRHVLRLLKQTQIQKRKYTCKKYYCKHYSWIGYWVLFRTQFTALFRTQCSYLVHSLSLTSIHSHILHVDWEMFSHSSI